MRPIPTNPGSMEAGEYGLTRGTCFVARRLEVVAVAGLLWISWCFLGGAGFFRVFFFLRTHPAFCKYEAAFPHLTLPVRMYHGYVPGVILLQRYGIAYHRSL